VSVNEKGTKAFAAVQFNWIFSQPVAVVGLCANSAQFTATAWLKILFIM
jgi:hypothetical protein